MAGEWRPEGDWVEAAGRPAAPAPGRGGPPIAGPAGGSRPRRRRQRRPARRRPPSRRRRARPRRRRDAAAAGSHGAGGPRRHPPPDLVRPPRPAPSSASSAGSGRGSAIAPIRPDRSAPARPRARRPPRPARPLAARRPGRRQPPAPHVPPRRAVPDALRRGLSRADGDGVPAGLALRPVARHLRVDPPAPGQVRDGRRPRPVGRGSRRRHERPRRPGPRRADRAAPARTRRRPADRPATGCTWRPAARSGPTTWRPATLISVVPAPGVDHAGLRPDRAAADPRLRRRADRDARRDGARRRRGRSRPVAQRRSPPSTTRSSTSW